MAFHFSMRFRESSEEEGRGSLAHQFSWVEATRQDALITEVARVLAAHPDVIFDGMDCWYDPERSV